jgi:hypothetical protein
MCLVAAIVTVITPTRAFASGKLRNGRFWMTCAFSHRLSDDPIFSPGQPGVSHSHDFFGNDTTDAASNYQSMLAGGTTCVLPGDTAGYWVPTLLRVDAPVAIKQINVYYWGFRGETTVFPADLRMVAGATAGVPSGTTSSSKKVGWMCVPNGQVFAAPPNCGADFVHMVVTFPSCWDGVNTDSPDHHGHLSYPVHRGCPVADPVIVPRLVIHVIYDLHDGTGAELSSDMMAGAPAGSTVHADFWNTWDQASLERLVATCIDTGPNCVFKGTARPTAFRSIGSATHSVR